MKAKFDFKREKYLERSRFSNLMDKPTFCKGLMDNHFLSIYAFQVVLCSNFIDILKYLFVVNVFILKVIKELYSEYIRYAALACSHHIMSYFLEYSVTQLIHTRLRQNMDKDA